MSGDFSGHVECRYSFRPESVASLRRRAAMRQIDENQKPTELVRGFSYRCVGIIARCGDVAISLSSAFAMMVYERWYLVTAGHVATYLRSLGPATTFELVAGYANNGTELAPTFAFDFHAATKNTSTDRLGFDFVALSIDEKSRVFLEKCGVRPFERRQWRASLADGVRPDYYMSGFPDARFDATKKTFAFAVYRVEVFSQGESPEFYGKKEHDLPTVGMSGAPLIAKEGGNCWVLGLFVAYQPSSGLLKFQKILPLAKRLEVLHCEEIDRERITRKKFGFPRRGIGAQVAFRA